MNSQSQNEFFKTELIANQAIHLMKDGYKSYFALYDEYHAQLRNLSENHSANFGEMLNGLKSKLFDENIFGGLEKSLEEFLEIKFKLKGSLADDEQKLFYAQELFEVVDSVSSQLQIHKEFKKYKDVALNNQAFVDFVHQISAIKNKWLRYSSKYLYASGIFQAKATAALKDGFIAARLEFVGDKDKNLNYSQVLTFFAFLNEVADFILKTQGESADEDMIQLLDMTFVDKNHVNIGVHSLLYPNLVNFLAQYKNEGLDISNSVKQALTSCVAQSMKIYGKEAANLVNSSNKKIIKSLSALDKDFRIELVDPLSAAEIAKTSQANNARVSQHKPQEKPKKTEAPANEQLQTEQKPQAPKKEIDTEQIRASKSHIGFLTA